jgi:tetratricopeptide (TPR) repeat protein
MFVHRRNLSRLLLVIAGVLFLLLPPQSAGGQPAGAADAVLCNDTRADPDVRIPACTRLLDHPSEGINLADVYNHRGAAKVRKGDLDDAIADFTSALNQNPKSVDAFKNRGIAHHMQGNYNAAIADFNRALRFDAKSPDLSNARGLALFKKGEYDGAIRDFDKAIALDPKYKKAYVNRGLALHYERQLDRAIADFNVYLRLAPDDPTGYLDRASVRMDKGNFKGAVDDYNQAIRLDPNNSGPYTRRGEAWRLQGNLQQSLADHNKAIELNPNDKEAYNNRALTLKDQGKLDEAIADCDQAIMLDPAYDFAYATRGLIRRLKGNLGGSLTDLNKAVNLDPRSPVALTFRGDTLRESGNYDGALADFNKVILMILPDCVAAYTGRGLTYEKMGNLAKAKADYEKALSLSVEIDAGLAKPAKDLARAHLAALAAGPKESGGDTAKAVREAAEKARAELERFKEEAKLRENTAAEAAATAREELKSFKQQAERREKATPEVVPDPGTRVALVIGNSQYRNVEFLPNPQRDAEAVADTFRKLGFQVVAAQNLTLQQFRSAVDTFEEEVKKGADWAVIYFAGHGLEVGGVNFLVPVDAKLVADKDVKYEAVPLDDLLLAAGKAKKLRLVILDACRNNPFVPRMQKTMASRSIGRGFARVEPEAGTLVAYSAGDGQVAEDGDGEHSPFTQAFLKNVVQPRLEVGMLFRRVYDDVRAATHDNQEPATHYSLPGELFYFAK